MKISGDTPQIVKRAAILAAIFVTLRGIAVSVDTYSCYECPKAHVPIKCNDAKPKPWQYVERASSDAEQRKIYMMMMMMTSQKTFILNEKGGCRLD